MRVDLSDISPNHSRFLQSKKAANSFLCLRQQGREGGKILPTRATNNFEFSRYFFKSFVFGPIYKTHVQMKKKQTKKQNKKNIETLLLLTHSKHSFLLLRLNLSSNDVNMR
jgi:hypothetical protein